LTSSQTFHDLHNYSIQHRASFWNYCWKYFQIIHEGSYEAVVDKTARIDTIPHWFHGVRLNFAENILFSTDERNRLRGKEDDKVAVVEVREAGAEGASYVTWKELRQRTGRLVQALKAHGVNRGDRIAVCASNSVDTLLVFLATTALGAIFSSMATDMGTKGLLDRLLQIKPVWLFMDDFAVYNGKTVDLRAKMAAIVKGLDAVAEFKGVVAQPRFATCPSDLNGVPRACTLDDLLAAAPDDHLEFERVQFRDPFLVVYSSGTTGQPKCIVHSVGGVLLNAHKEGSLHQEMGPDSVILQYTTTGWIMYLALVQGLLFGARIIQYDGNPFLPHAAMLIELAAKER
jgi:acetoacetyl-CoA synthetase